MDGTSINIRIPIVDDGRRVVGRTTHHKARKRSDDRRGRGPVDGVMRLTEDPKHIHPSSIQTRPWPPMIDCVDKARKRSDRVMNSPSPSLRVDYRME
eukprot:scaffold312171_cov28-Attheya_sp.AAC.1